MSNPNTSVRSFPVELPADPTLPSHAATKRYVDQQDDTKVSRAGDSMTGPLILAGSPNTDNEAATKAYVDSIGTPTAGDVAVTPAGSISATDAQAALQELDSEKVAKAGDSMTGALLLNTSTPTQSLQAVPKTYADSMGTTELSFLPGDYVWNGTLGVYELTINHNLNRRPKVTIYDSNGVEIWGGVVYNTISTNGLVVQLKINPTVKVLLT